MPTFCLLSLPLPPLPSQIFKTFKIKIPQTLPAPALMLNHVLHTYEELFLHIHSVLLVVFFC